MSVDVPSKKGKSEFHYLGDLTTLDNLHLTLGFPLSPYHKPELKKEEEEIFDHYVRWQDYNDNRFATDPDEGATFFDMPHTVYYDLMGFTPRGQFGDHFKIIGPYFAKSSIGYKDMEIIATAPDSGYVNMIQHYYGTSSDGNDFDFTFRYTGFLHKKDGKWQWIQEHLSFPVDVATRKADFTCNQSATEKMYVKE